MAVYVDESRWPYTRMIMCHMIADTHAELMAMADRIGVQRRWLQQAGTGREHFDICKSKKEAALAAGAVEITSRELVLKLRARKES